jgi:stage V sporulation protein R
MNEGWACATGDSLVLTEEGFVYFDELHMSGRKIGVASSGPGKVNYIADFHKEERVPTIRIRTRRGLTIEGALKHRIRVAGGNWAYLRDVKLGDSVVVATCSNIWPAMQSAISYTPALPSATLCEVATVAGISVATVMRHLKGQKTRSAIRIESAIRRLSYPRPPFSRVLKSRSMINIPETLNEDLGWLLGHFIGDGNYTKSGICLTTGDSELAVAAVERIERLFGLRAIPRWDNSGGGGRWRVYIHSRELKGLFTSLGLKLEYRAREKRIPNSVLQSPKSVMSSFLRGYFDADGYAGKEGVRLSSSSELLVGTVQIVLLNYGILSRQRYHQDGCVQLEITGASAAVFLSEIGFSLQRKQEALRRYVESHRWFKPESSEDEIVSIEVGQDDVYDVTVETRHSYVANGFVNHNSIWHSRIMREMNLPTNDHLEFAELHAGVVSPHKGQLNPYYLGYKIFEDIEKRWNEPSAEERNKYGRKGSEGLEKMMEVRELDNDISFLRNYLTEELCEELDLYVYQLVDDEEWTVTDKKWEKVRDQLVANMTNFGFPYIEVLDGDYDRNRELYLMHRFEGVEMDLKYARKTLEYVYKLWGRDVHLETVVDDEPLVMHFNGSEHDED